MPKKKICPVCFGRGNVETVGVTICCPDCGGIGLVNTDHPGFNKEDED